MIPTTYADLIPATDVTVGPEEAARFDAAIEAAAARLAIKLADVPALPRLRVRLDPPGEIQARAQQLGDVCADRVLELTLARHALISTGHVLAYQVLGVEDPWESESYARQAEGPTWLATSPPSEPPSTREGNVNVRTSHDRSLGQGASPSPAGPPRIAPLHPAGPCERGRVRGPGPSSSRRG